MIFDSRLLIKKFKYFYLKMSQNVYSFRYYIQNPDLIKNTGGDSLSNRLSDADKVELLYELYEKDMFRICVSVLRDPYEAEDALSECFVKYIAFVPFDATLKKGRGTVVSKYNLF